MQSGSNVDVWRYVKTQVRIFSMYTISYIFYIFRPFMHTFPRKYMWCSMCWCILKEEFGMQSAILAIKLKYYDFETKEWHNHAISCNMHLHFYRVSKKIIIFVPAEMYLSRHQAHQNIYQLFFNIISNKFVFIVFVYIMVMQITQTYMHLQ